MGSSTLRTVAQAKAEMRRKHQAFVKVGRLGLKFWDYIAAATVLEKLTGRKVVAGKLQ